MAQAAKHIIFKGRVQGVGFRYTVRRIADGFSLTGFVRNLPDGAVEMFAQGEDSDIQSCLSEIGEYFEGYIRQSKIEDSTFNPCYTSFGISY